MDVRFYKARKIPAGKNGKEISVKEITGTLKDFSEDSITIETDFSEDYEIMRAEISTVKLTIDF